MLDAEIKSIPQKQLQLLPEDETFFSKEWYPFFGLADGYLNKIRTVKLVKGKRSLTQFLEDGWIGLIPASADQILVGRRRH